MRPKYESNSAAQRLNNALAQLHSCKLEHQRDKEQLISQLERTREENQKFKLKNKELKKQIRDIELQGGRDSQNNSQAEQILQKIQNYLKRLQQSSQQLSQIAAECRIVDADIERAASQIQRNVIKTTSGLTKYVSQLVKRWGSNQKMRLQHHRLAAENRQLFELTATLQQNFKQTDKLIKELQSLQKNEDEIQEVQILKKKIEVLQKQNGKIKNMLHTKPRALSPKTKDNSQLEQKIVLFSQKIRRLEQQNITIKNIHQRTMKKLEKLQQKNQQKQEKQEKPFEGQALQDERKKWLEKTEQMYEEIRRLTKELMISQQNEKKIRDQLNSCLQIYSRWQEEREHKKSQIEELKRGIETYLLKLEQLQSVVSQKNNQIEDLLERCEISEGQKQKIVSVYQLQVQEITDQLFKKQDALTQLEEILNKEHYKLQELKKQYVEANKICALSGQKAKRIEQQNQQLRGFIKQQQNAVKLVENKLAQGQLFVKRLKSEHKTETNKLNSQIERLEHQKQELSQILQQIKDQYSSAKRQILKNQQALEDMKQEHDCLENQMRDILSCFDNSVEIRTLISRMRQKFKTSHQQLKILREAQIRIVSQLQSKQAEYSQEIQSIENKYLQICQQLQSTNSNQQAQFKIFKMKLLQNDLSDEQTMSFSTTLADLLQILINKSCINLRQNQPSPSKKKVQDIILLKQELIQKNAQLQVLKKQFKQASHQLAILNQQILWKDKLMEQSKQQIAALQQSVQSVLQEKKLMDSRMHLFQKANNQSQQKVNALIQEKGLLQEGLDQLKSEFQFKLHQVKEYGEKNNALQHQLQSSKQIRERSKRIEMQNAELKVSAQSLQVQLEKMTCQRQLLAQKAENNEGLLMQNKQLIISNQNLKSQLQLALKQIADLLAQSEQLSYENAQLQQQIIELNSKLLLTEQKASLMLQNQTKLKEDLCAKQQYANETVQCLLKIQRQKQQLSILNSQMQKQLNEREILKRQAQNEDISNNYQLIKLNLELQQKINQIDHLENTLQKSSAENIRKDELIQSLNNEKRLVTHENQQLKEEVQLLRVKIQTLIANDADKDVQAVQQKQTELNHLKNELRDFHDQMDQLKTQLQRKDAMISRLIQQLEILRSKLLQYKQQINTKNQFSEEKVGLQIQKQQQIIEKEYYIQRQIQIRQMIDGDSDLPKHYHLITGQEQDDKLNQELKQRGLNQLAKQLQVSKSQVNEETKLIQKLQIQIARLNDELLQLQQKQKGQNKQTAFLNQQMRKYQQQIDNNKRSYFLLEAQYRELQEIIQLQRLEISQKQIQKVNQLQIWQLTKKDLLAHINKLSSEIQVLKVKQKLYAEKIAEKQCQGQFLKTTFDQKEAQFKSSQAQLEKTKKQKQVYCSRLQEIQHLMQEMQNDEIQAAKLRQVCEENQTQRQAMLEKIEQLQAQVNRLNQNLDFFKNNNLQLIDQRTFLDNKIRECQLRLCQITESRDKSIQQNIQFQNLSDAISQKGQSIKQFSIIIDQLRFLQSQDSQNKQIKSQYLREIGLLKDKIKQFQRISFELQSVVNSQNIKIQNLQSQYLKSSQMLKQVQIDNDQGQTLKKLNLEFQTQIGDLKDEIEQKKNKVNQLKAKLSKQQTLNQQLQQKYNQKCRQVQILKVQSQKYKTQIKKISRQKVLAQNQMMKFKCDLQKNQQSSKLRQSQVQDQIKKCNTESSLIIKDLKRQIIELKEAKSVLRQHKSTFYQQKTIRQERSEKDYCNQDQYTKDLPLQIGSRVSRQGSIRSEVQQKSNQQYQSEIDKNRQLIEEQNKKLKSELSRIKEDSKLKETQKNYKTISNQLQYLKGEMKVKNLSIQTLQKQYKSKVEDYSKLQRNVESLTDQLNLQRKRVKNFEDLYQNIQAKRLKLTRPEE